jgi:hypothetical protein
MKLADIILKGGRMPPASEFSSLGEQLHWIRQARIRQERRQMWYSMANLACAIVVAVLLCWAFVSAMDALHRYLHPLH